MIGAAYRAAHDRIVRAVTRADPATPVPACPEWTVQDVVSHLTGLAADVVSGETDGYAGDEWTQAQVEARRTESLGDVLAEWSGLVDEMCTVLDDPDSSSLPEVVHTAAGPAPRRSFPGAVLGDVLHHQFDIYHALGITEGRESLEVMVSAVGHAKALRPVFTAHGLDTLRVEFIDTGESVDVGRAEPAATLRASSFEIMRAIGGRRTLAEIRAMDWEGEDPEPFIGRLVLPYMEAPAEPLGESG